MHDAAWKEVHVGKIQRTTRENFSFPLICFVGQCGEEINSAALAENTRSLMGAQQIWSEYRL